MIKVKCLCCGIVGEFKDAEEAFNKGWDAPPHFTLEFCNLCPASLYVLGKSHEIVHKYWEDTGRPENFSVAICVEEGSEVASWIASKINMEK